MAAIYHFPPRSIAQHITSTIASFRYELRRGEFEDDCGAEEEVYFLMTPRTDSLEALPEEEYAERTSKQQSVITELVRNEVEDLSRCDASIADAADADESYPQKVRDEYGHIVDGYASNGVIPEPTADDGGINFDLVYGGIDPQDIPEIEDEEVREIAEMIGKHDRVPPERLADCLDVAPERVRQVREEYSDRIEIIRRRFLLEFIERDCDEFDAEIREEWDELTCKQKSTSLELAKEPDPLSPEREKKTIAHYADVHPTYIDLVIERAGLIAVRLRSAWIETVTLPGTVQEDDQTVDTVPADELEQLRETVQFIAQMADAEIESGATDSAAGRKTVAEYVEGELGDILEQ